MRFPLVQLGDICQITMGQAPDGETYNLDGAGVPLIAGAGDFGETSPAASKFTTAPTKTSKVGDIILCIRATIGDRNWSDISYCLGRGVAGLFAMPGKLDQKYLWHWLGYAAPSLKAKGRGATFLQVNKADISTLGIPLPSLEEQRRIATVLDKADALRVQRRAAIAKLDELLQSVFIEMFEQSEETDWDEMTIADVVDPIAGMRTGPFGSQLLHSEFVSEGVAVLGIDNAVSNEFRWGERRFIREEKYRTLKRYTVRPGDVLITIMGTNGRCAIVPKDIPLAINTKHLCCITLDKSKCLPEFLHSYFLRHSRAKRYLGGKAKGAIMAGLNMGIIKAMPIQLPPVKLQKRFADIAARIEAQKQTMQLAAEKSENLFASLQQLAFSGKL